MLQWEKARGQDCYYITQHKTYLYPTFLISGKLLWIFYCFSVSLLFTGPFLKFMYYVFLTDVFAASRQRVGPREPRHSVLPNATRYGPHPLCGARRPSWTRRAHTRGLTRQKTYLDNLRLLDHWNIILWSYHGDRHLELLSFLQIYWPITLLSWVLEQIYW